MKEIKIDIPFKTKLSFQRPYVYQKSSISAVCIRMMVFLVLQFIVLIHSKSYSAVGVISTTLSAAICASAVQYFVSKVPLYSLIPTILEGFMCGFLFPENYPLFAAFVLVFLVLLIINYVFSGFANNWANPIVLIVIVAWFVGKKYFPAILLDPQNLITRNPSLFFVQDSKQSIAFFDPAVTDFLNKYVFHYFKVSIPQGYVSFLWDNHSIIPAFRFNFLTLIASVYLFSDDSVEILIPSVFIVTYCALVRLFAPMLAGGAFNSGDIILCLFSSGTLFFTVFVLGWYGTVPMTKGGKFILAVSGGVVAFLVVGAGTSFIGMAFTVLFCNLLNLILRLIEDNKNYARLASRG